MRRVVIISHAYVHPGNRGKLPALAARDVDLTVGVPQRWIEPGLGRPVEITWERASGVELFPVPAKDPGDPAVARFGRRALSALLRDKRPELVHVEEEPNSRMARQVVGVARRLGIPVVLHMLRPTEDATPLMERWRRRRTLRRLKGVMAESEAAAASVGRDAPGLPVRVCPQFGVQVPTSPEHVPHEGLALGFVGRLVPEKGLDTLLHALGELRGESWHLVVVGDGPDRERLESLANSLRLAARIRWTGALPPERLPRIWSEIDALIALPRATATRTEHTGQLLVEAMAHEVAIVATKVGVLPEVVGEAGIVLPPEDFAGLVDALRHLTTESARRPLVTMGRARAMKHFSNDAVAERTAEFWGELLR
jgi:glycosyltransferase involved in cell wall biosynthesis